MTLLSFINDSLQFALSIFTAKTDIMSLILSDVMAIHITTLYYKLQYTLDFVYLTLASLYSLTIGSFSTISLNSIIVALKFVSLIALLIFIRGGIPRYRFDHLTKIGWIKYLSLVLASILIQFFLLWMC